MIDGESKILIHRTRSIGAGTHTRLFWDEYQAGRIGADEWVGLEAKMTRSDSDGYADILNRGVPLLDVRAPVEFSQGAFPGAINLPLMEDEERHRVGKRYKQAGQDSAIKLGHELVSGQIKNERVAKWVEFAKAHLAGVRLNRGAGAGWGRDHRASADPPAAGPRAR